MKRLVGWLCVMILCLSAPMNVLANEINQHKNEMKEIEQDITEKKEQLDQVKGEQSKVASQLKEIDKDLKLKEEELARIEKKLDETIAELENTRAELKEAEEEARKFEVLMADRLCAMYMMEGTSYLELLFGAKSLNEFMDRLEMIKFMITYDNQVFDKMIELRNAIQEKEEELALQEEAIKETKADITKQKSLIEQKKQERLQVMAKLKEEEQQYEKDLEILEQTSKELEKTIQKLLEEQKRKQEEQRRREEEQRRKEEEQKNKNNGQNDQSGNKDQGSGQKDQDRGSEYTGGVLAWPVPGFNRITSGFGPRTHPVTGEVQKPHYGIDIGSNSNASINGVSALAAADGVVILSQYYGGYGNCVIIDHGGGITTVYAHGSQRLVSVGQKVTRGQAVLKIGSTGVSTGPHLHFEVRENGVAVNPLPYLGR